jgi:15-cis-phytoene desaturase
MAANYDTIVIGAGLAGLSAAFELTEQKQKVLILEAARQVGGRTSNWKEKGMDVESGIHKFVGVYKEFPRLLQRAGLDLDRVFVYQDEIEIRVAEGGERNHDPRRRRRSGRFGLSLLHRPFLTIGGALGNGELLPWRDKLRLAYVFVCGILDYLRDPDALDRSTIADYARKRGASANLVDTVLYALSGGLFFLPPERYGALPFFSLAWESTKRSYASRLAIFRGGMTDVMARPLAEAILRRGGELRLQTPVERISMENGSVTGVWAGGVAYRAPRVVLATPIASARKIIEATFGDDLPRDAELQKLLSLPDMSGVAVQLELDRPGLPDDHGIFGPNSILGTFAEQSHTTFAASRGRISTFLSPAEPYMDMKDEAILADVIRDLARQGVDVANHVSSFAVVRHASDFYRLEPRSEARRPRQRTTVPGLALAGDYTKQPFICSMEGAVVSGRLAAEALLEARQYVSPKPYGKSGS